MIKTAIILPDIHYPYHDKPSIKAIESFMPKFKPDYLVYLGDQIDLAMVKAYFDKKGSAPEKGYIIQNYIGFNEIMERHIKILPKTQFVFLEGNHEERIKRLLDKAPIYRGADIEVEKYFKFKERGIKFVPYNQIFKLGKLHYIHGIYVNKHHACATVMAYQRNMRYGHTHDHQSYTHVTPIDVKDTHTAMSLGCLCNINPEWMKNKPNKWIHGFGIAYVRDNGDFNDYFIPITRGKFIFEGKVYG